MSTEWNLPHLPISLLYLHEWLDLYFRLRAAVVIQAENILLSFPLSQKTSSTTSELVVYKPVESISTQTTGCWTIFTGFKAALQPLVSLPGAVCKIGFST